MYVLREIWQNNVANGNGMLFSVLKEMWRNPTKKKVKIAMSIIENGKHWKVLLMVSQT